MSALTFSDESLSEMGVRRSQMLNELLEPTDIDGIRHWSLRTPDHHTQETTAPTRAHTEPEPAQAGPVQADTTTPDTDAEWVEPHIRLRPTQADSATRPAIFQLNERDLIAAARRHYLRTQGFRKIDPDVAFAAIPGLLGRTAAHWLVTQTIKNPSALHWAKRSFVPVCTHTEQEATIAAIHALARHHYPMLSKLGTTPAAPEPRD